MSALVLWDIDHTLVENAGVSKETYAGAFEALAGFPPRQPVRTEGRTDRLIMRDLFERHHLATPTWPDVLTALTEAGERYAGEMRRRGSLLPGVADALVALSHMPGLVQSLLTGNIEANARMKLVAVGIDSALDFSVGAYGGDADDRADLVRVAQERAEARMPGHVFDAHNTVLIGDTPRDVDAGRRGGAHVIAVASGVDTVDDLHKAGATFVIPDLADTTALVKEIGRLIN